MLEFSARMFFWCGQILAELRTDCLIGSMNVPGDTPIFAVVTDFDERAREKASRCLKHVETEFRSVGLRITAETVAEIIAVLENEDVRRNYQWLMDKLETIKGLANKEINGKAFFYVPAERAKFFPTIENQHIFGSEVGAAFSSAAYDISEAGTCLALARGTASVLHLMRVLEIGLTVLGNKFGVSLAHTNWAPAIEEIESKVRDMHKDPVWKALPDCKEQQEFYAQAASHFGVLKDAWRNYATHVRGKFTEEEAEIIFINVKGFMQKLAERLHE